MSKTDLLFGHRLKMSVGFLVGRSQKRYNRPVELCFVGLNDRTLVDSAIFCFILKPSCGFIYFLIKKATSLAKELKN